MLTVETLRERSCNILRMRNYPQFRPGGNTAFCFRCVEVPDGTPGLLLAKISERTPFAGYRGDKKQTESKIIRDAFEVCMINIPNNQGTATVLLLVAYAMSAHA